MNPNRDTTSPRPSPPLHGGEGGGPGGAGLLEVLLRPTVCPVVAWEFSEEDVLGAEGADLDEIYREFQEREERIRKAAGDPYAHGFWLAHWDEVKAAMELGYLFLALLGGNRSAKSELCAWLTVHAIVEHPDTTVVCGSENETTSIETQQKLIWKYLPNWIKKLNGKRDGNRVYQVMHSEANGFSDRKLVLPNRSKILFKTYNQEPTTEIEGQEFGNREALTVGAWMDENLPLGWLKALMRRLEFRAAHLLWSYTPVLGITTAIQELAKGARTLKSKRAELLPGDRVHVSDCPAGHMPTVQEPALARCRIFYFFSEFNPFGAGGRPYYEAVKANCAGKTEEYIMKIAYGYTRKTTDRQFSAFGPHNLVDRSELPAVGTNYQFVDPAGARHWMTLWVRVTPGNPGRRYVYRDWPDEPRFGAWAEPDEKTDRKDGVTGPAQRATVFSYDGYKEVWLAAERILPEFRQGVVAETDPHRRGLIFEGLAAAGLRPLSRIDQGNGAPLPHQVQRAKAELVFVFGQEAVVWAKDAEVSEAVFDRYIDPRAARDERVSQEGGTCIIDELAKETVDAVSGAVTHPAMDFKPAKGLRIEAGVAAVNAMLALPNPGQPVCAIVNEPQLYICRDCLQVIWCLENYTGIDGEKGASKDPADLLRYMATAELDYVDPAGLRSFGGGSY